MISLDSAVIDPSPGVKKIAAAAGPALAASWLGYGQSPSFYEQEAPLVSVSGIRRGGGHGGAERAGVTCGNDQAGSGCCAAKRRDA